MFDLKTPEECDDAIKSIMEHKKGLLKNKYDLAQIGDPIIYKIFSLKLQGEIIQKHDYNRVTVLIEGDRKYKVDIQDIVLC